MNASSSSVSVRPEPGRPLPALVEAWRRHEDRHLLAPLRLVGPGPLALGAPPAVDRSAVAAALADANAGYGHPEASGRAELLSDPATRVVVTGQQPGLFGGPLYSLIKMIAAVRWAERLAAAGEPAVALFWVATEDHDYDEVAHADFWHQGTLHRHDLGPDPEPLTPVGMRSLGPTVVPLLDELEARYPFEPFAAWLRQLGTWYRPDARFGEAFSRLAVDLLGARAPLLVDSQLPELKTAQAPWLERLIVDREAVGRCLADRERLLTAAGYPLQVTPQPDAALLSLLSRQGRRRIQWSEAGFSLRGLEEAARPMDELLRAVADNPGVVSPNALARPVIQDAVFGTSLQVLGPGELSYFAQAAPLYPLLGVTPPAVVLRPSVLPLETRQLAALDDSELPLSVILGPEEALDACLAARAGVVDLGAVRAQVVDALAGVRAAALALDPHLERPWEKTRDSMTTALDRFQDKLVRAAAQRDEVARSRIDALRAWAQPEGKPVERVLSVAYLRGRYGPRAVARLLDELDLDEPGLQRFVLDPEVVP